MGDSSYVINPENIEQSNEKPQAEQNLLFDKFKEKINSNKKDEDKGFPEKCKILYKSKLLQEII